MPIALPEPTARHLGLGEGLGDQPDPLDVRQVGQGPAPEGCPPDLPDIRQVGRASIIGQMWAPLTASTSIWEHLQGSPDLLDIRQVGRGPTRWEGREMLKKVIERSYILLELLIAITQVIYQSAQFKKAISAHDDLLPIRLRRPKYR